VTRLIPNENTYIGFVPTIVDIHAPKTSELATAIDVTSYALSVTAATTGNTVPTPSLDTLFETSIAGTVSGSFTADFYRDDEEDLAWETFPRKQKGYVVLSRFGGSGPGAVPIAADTVEVWPILVVSRTMSAGGNNTVLTFTMTAAVPEEPDEEAIIGA
jgi:hypothetical protein